eukprot:5628131-Pleurochrysis_carterae.AAC.1
MQERSQSHLLTTEEDKSKYLLSKHEVTAKSRRASCRNAITSLSLFIAPQVHLRARPRAAKRKDRDEKPPVALSPRLCHQVTTPRPPTRSASSSFSGTSYSEIPTTQTSPQLFPKRGHVTRTRTPARRRDALVGRACAHASRSRARTALASVRLIATSRCACMDRSEGLDVNACRTSAFSHAREQSIYAGREQGGRHARGELKRAERLNTVGSAKRNKQEKIGNVEAAREVEEVEQSIEACSVQIRKGQEPW